jgi:hypothetical protein
VNIYGLVKDCYYVAARPFLISCFVYSSTLKMEAILYSEMSVWLLPVCRALHPRRQLFGQAGYINFKHYFLWSDVHTWHCLASSYIEIRVGPHIQRIYYNLLNDAVGARSNAVVKALCYEPEGREFETWWDEWIFSIYLILPAALGPWVYSASNRNECQKQKIMFMGSRALPAHKVDNLTSICESIV